MKVLLINGSPHAEGCTYTALCEIARQLAKCEVESEFWQIGTKPLAGCIACGACHRTRNQCTQGDEAAEVIAKIKSADGVIIGSPVHYAGIAGNLSSLLDRVFFAKDSFAGKPAAAIVSCRRGGNASAHDRLNKYFTISQMPVVSSQYWNGVHGNTPDEVRRDLEGMQIMRTLANNMAWLLKCIEAGRAAGISFPEPEPRVGTNFIR
ncbi:MAG: flavodoxin family protein [Oscillospiraceae bacterium]|jgi:multimeric flavodoxin WrbA|nr:flavodoxin family protein [Oscillospiraceae bacterium]